MQRSALRSIYGNSHPKTKNAAAVSPVLDQSEHDEENPSSSYPDEDEDSDLQQKRLSNNWSASDMVNRVPDEEPVVLQKKSVQVEIPRLPHRTTGNQEQERQHLDVASGSAKKSTVLGQKHKWRKTRAQRSRHKGHTILSVDEDAAGSGGDNDDDDDLENPSTSRSSSASFLSVTERLHSARSEGYFNNLPGRIPSSSGRSSDISDISDSQVVSSRSTSSNGDDEKQRFVITRQKKSKYAARIHLPGQNPLYLGRYKNEAAALAACESAYSVIMTPRK